jgi:hypothetical protein
MDSYQETPLENVLRRVGEVLGEWWRELEVHSR